MGDLSDALADAGPNGPTHHTSRRTAPTGWDPGFDLDHVHGGTITSLPYDANDNPPSVDAIFAQFSNLNSSEWIVVNYRESRWQRWDGEWLESRRLNVRPARPASPHDSELIELIEKWKPRKIGKTADLLGFVAPTGDTQVGKGDPTGGTDSILPFVLGEFEKTVNRLRNDLPRGHVAPEITLPWLGDCVEGNQSQGGRLVMRLDRTITEQVRIYRRLMWAQIRAFLSVAERLVIPVVPGNHDQAHRIGDQLATRNDDSWAIDGASAVMDGVNENPELRDRVRFVFPTGDDATLTLDINGTVVAIAHGHLFGRDPLKWWDGQAAGRLPAGDADLLLAGHLHTLHVQDHGGRRVFLQIPAMDNGSPFFTNKYGGNAPSRQISFWTGDGHIWGLTPVI